MALRENLKEWASTPFESQAAQIAAMSDVQYRNVPEYRAAVEQKLSFELGSGIAPTIEAIKTTRWSADTGIVGNPTSTASKAQIAARKTDEELYAELMGPSSVRPTSRAKSQAELLAARAQEAKSNDELHRVHVRAHGVEDYEG